MNDEQLRELLHVMRDDPVPPDSLARVRQAVAARISERTGRRGLAMMWKLALPLALAGCLAALLLRPSIRHPPPAPVQPVATVEQPAPAPVPPKYAAVPSKRAHPAVTAARHLQPKTPPATEQAGASLIRIETPDPGVVILLLADGGSESSRRPAVREY